MMATGRARAEIARMIDNRTPFTGSVIRRAPADYQRRSVHLTWRCVNEYCGNWTMNGAYLVGRCNFCSTPRPAERVQ